MHKKYTEYLLYTNIDTYIPIYVGPHEHTQAYKLSVHKYAYVYMHAYICIHMYIYISINKYAHTYA